MASSARMLVVYTIVEKEGADKPFWVKVGACFPNRDGSLNVYLDALPANGRLHIRESGQDEKNRPSQETNPQNQKKTKGGQEQ